MAAVINIGNTRFGPTFPFYLLLNIGIAWVPVGGPSSLRHRNDLSNYRRTEGDEPAAFFVCSFRPATS
jgi:hypothetical protein